VACPPRTRSQGSTASVSTVEEPAVFVLPTPMLEPHAACLYAFRPVRNSMRPLASRRPSSRALASAMARWRGENEAG
jgi:hypothetical protein